MQEALLQFSDLRGLTSFFKSLDERPYRINIAQLTLSGHFTAPELDRVNQCDPAARIQLPGAGGAAPAPRS
ncbi:hypothetical protein [Flaviaesturariibacter amylovorans]|uniref:Uncharacterized protein n=1 Tax=Flaviaesturariibacter amylovorans TaxID=1084520 RepID=A0ABP8H7V3_9BACT